MACPNCRSAVSERASFCIRCGTPLSKQGRTCPNCRSAVSERASFCTRCGTPLSKRGSNAKKILKWVGIGVGGILGLCLAIVIVAAITTDSTSSPATPEPFGDGLWKIGEEIIPGTYAAPGGRNCLWHFATGFSGTINDIARVGSSSSGRPIVTIETEDRGFHVVGFQTFGCGEWRPIADINNPVTFITEGVWLVGKEITPGVYQSSENCFWSRLSGFKDESTDVIAGGLATAGSPVVIEPTDAGFRSFGCEVWTRVE